MTLSEQEMKSMANQQEHIRQQLEAFGEKLKEDAGNLSEEYRELQTSAYEFYNKMQDLKIDGAMQKGVDAGQNNDGPGMHLQAETARKKMEQLLSSCNGEGFGGMCEAKMGFKISKSGGSGMKQTLAQLMAALLGQNGSGSGLGQGAGGNSGSGPGGPSSSGNWARGKSMVAVPIYGPARTAFATTSFSAFAASGGQQAGSSIPSKVETEHSEIAPEKNANSERYPQEMIPDQYRDALRRFYSQPETNPTTSNLPNTP